jgi:methylmalonyl-CoA mutase cobalamin-binding domain/chain
MTRTAFCTAEGVASEAEHKARAKACGEVTWHMHLGLTDWPATEAAVDHVVAGLAEHGHRVQRFGLCLSQAMGVPEARRAGTRKDTGPLLEPGDWARVAAAPVQPHLGDFMIGTSAGLENTRRALGAGITTIGNLGQFLAFDPPDGTPDAELAAITLDALRLMAAHRDRGALVHSYLDDGPAMQLDHLGAYVGWAALELHLVEDLIGARLAHCHGGLVPDPRHRAIVALALDDLRDGDSLGSMVYGNTVGYDGRREHDLAVLAQSVSVDVATQLRRPTGHAVNPVPLTEGQRIPSAEEVLEVHLIARELEREVRAGAAVLDWPEVERRAAEVTEHALAFRTRALAALQEDGVDVGDPAALLLALRRVEPEELQRRVDLEAPAAVRRLETWKHAAVARVAARVRESTGALHGVRLVLAALEVHDVVRDALAKTLPEHGAEVVLLPSDASAAQVARAAADEDAEAVVVASYNGGALSLGRELTRALDEEGHAPLVVFGGVLNEDDGGPLPVDARPGLAALGIRTVDRVEELAPLLQSAARSTTTQF